MNPSIDHGKHLKNSRIPVAWLALALLFQYPLLLAQQESGPPGVIVTQAKVKSFPLSAEALGNARANESVDIRPKITATLTEILFEEGQEVGADAVLVKLDNLEQVADLAAAQAALVDSEASYRRSSELFRNKVVAK